MLILQVNYYIYYKKFRITIFLYLGNVYIADTVNRRIRKVTVSTGIITTIVGTGSTGYTGDGGKATSATLKVPADVAIDSAGSSVN